MKNYFAIILTALVILFTTGCTADYQVIADRDTKVVVDFQAQPGKIESLDVLVVLDTSGSMSDNYDEVADGMDILRADIESITLDYQFGYITMDPTNLSYVGPYDSSSTPIDMLMAPSLLSSTLYEEGFGATYTFFGTEEGLAFRRPGADFLLFLISDEDEQSTIPSDLFYDWLHVEFQGVRHDVVCIANPEDDEQQNTWQNEIGYKYIELSDLYGKDMLDIKEEDWSVWLSDSSYLTQLSDIVYLTSPSPIVESIVVYVDSNITYDWHYSGSNNAVIFNTAPEHNAEIVVAYEVFVE